MGRPASSIRGGVASFLLRVLRRRPRPSSSRRARHPAASTSGRGCLRPEEHLYSFEREGRLPLLLLTATDTHGHLTSAVTCDSEDY